MMEFLYAFTVWFAIGLLSVGILLPMIIGKGDVELIRHMYASHDIANKTVVTAKFVGLIVLLSVGGPLATIGLLVIYVRQR